MTAPRQITFGTFALQAVGLTVLLLVVAWMMARSRYGAAGPPAVVTGLAISLLAALVSAWFLESRFGRRTGEGVESRKEGPSVARPAALLDSLGAMGVRLLVLTVLVVVAVVSDAFLTTPLLLSVAVGYVVLLGLETRFALALATEEAQQGAARDGEAPSDATPESEAGGTPDDEF